MKKFQKIFGLFLNFLFIRTSEYLNSIYIISSKIVRIVTFLKKIEFKVNFKQNETQIYTVNFKIIKFDLFVYFNIFYQFFKHKLFIFITALKNQKQVVTKTCHPSLLITLSNTISQSVDRHSFELNLKKTFKRFISRSSVYGVSRVLETDHKSVKLTWALLILLSSSFGVFMIAKNISEYFAYDVVTRTKTIETNGDHFPAISFCPSVFTDDTLEVKEIALDGVKLKDVKFEHVTSSGCYRFNSHNTTRGSTYLRAKNVGIYRGLRFLIQVNDPLNIYIADNHLDSFERAVQFLSDSKSTYLSIYKTNEIKKEYPFNKCQNLNATYRHLNCKQDCIYKQVCFFVLIIFVHSILLHSSS